MAPRTTPKSKKQIKEELAAVTDEDRLPGVIYIGHVPHGFYETQLKKYFSQFGKVLQIKLSRSNKTGKSKGYAFVKFKYAAVAKTVATTCHNYLFFDKLLKCEYRKLDDVHPNTFFSYKWKANTKPKRIHNAPRSATKLKALTDRSKQKQKKKLEKLNELGVDLQLKDIVTTKVPITIETETPSKKKKKSKTPDVKDATNKENTDLVKTETETPSRKKKRVQTPDVKDAKNKENTDLPTPVKTETETPSKKTKKGKTPDVKEAKTKDTPQTAAASSKKGSKSAAKSAGTPVTEQTDSKTSDSTKTPVPNSAKANRKRKRSETEDSSAVEKTKDNTINTKLSKEIDQIGKKK